LIESQYEGKTSGLLNVLENTPVEYEFIYLDTKRNPGEEHRRDAAWMAKNKINEIQPDVIISFDDDAFKYLIMPYYKDTEIPIVFAGVDWNASGYGVPYSNTTGMVSVDLVCQMLDHIKQYAKGERISWIGYDSLSARKIVKAYLDILDINMTVHYVANFEEWQNAFLHLQTETDIIIQSGMLTDMVDWDNDAARRFVQSNIQIPIGTINEQLMSCSMFGMVKNVSEFGEWTAKAALEIMDGKNPSDIAITQNKEGSIILNLDLAEQLDIAFDVSVLKSARIFGVSE
jgi:ABC-type uncharacterized transport system substrate-binding protein